MKFLVRKEYKGKNFLKQQIEIPAGSYVESQEGLVCFDRIPFCSENSQVARDYLIWAEDGEELQRNSYETIILFSPRERVWEEKVPKYDDLGTLIGYTIVLKKARFSPEEATFLKLNFSQFLLEGDAIVFNEYFYIGSPISEIRKIAEYLKE